MVYFNADCFNSDKLRFSWALCPLHLWKDLSMGSRSLGWRNRCCAILCQLCPNHDHSHVWNYCRDFQKQKDPLFRIGLFRSCSALLHFGPGKECHAGNLSAWFAGVGSSATEGWHYFKGSGSGWVFCRDRGVDEVRDRFKKQSEHFSHVQFAGCRRRGSENGRNRDRAQGAHHVSGIVLD